MLPIQCVFCGTNNSWWTVCDNLGSPLNIEKINFLSCYSLKISIISIKFLVFSYIEHTSLKIFNKNFENIWFSLLKLYICKRSIYIYLLLIIIQDKIVGNTLVNKTNYQN